MWVLQGIGSPVASGIVVCGLECGPATWCWMVRGLKECRPAHRWCKSSAFDGDSHRPGGAGDDLRRGVQVRGVEVFQLLLGDLPNLGGSELADLGLVRLAGTLGHP